DADAFQPGAMVKVTGTSKGRGFQGVVKRHHFAGGPASHGHKDNLRAPGSIGATWPQHVTKGTRMAGRMGGEQVSVRNLEVVEVVPDQHLLLVSGAVPGPRHGIVFVQSA
ncbi:MAG: 50S ribosomal protein L3, partial [Candidatus Kerfeldbacteria bacterium]|nr:50S ribosomal protein L3 [Candidatus Kerfeldbacteria bacterium]